MLAKSEVKIKEDVKKYAVNPLTVCAAIWSPFTLLLCSAERKAEIRRLKRELRGKTAEAEKQEREEESKKEEEKEGEESALDAYAREKQK